MDGAPVHNASGGCGGEGGDNDFGNGWAGRRHQLADSVIRHPEHCRDQSDDQSCRKDNIEQAVATTNRNMEAKFLQRLVDLLFAVRLISDAPADIGIYSLEQIVDGPAEIL